MARRMKSGMLVAGLALAACTPVGCALISGVGDLSVVGNGALDGTAPPLDFRLAWITFAPLPLLLQFVREAKRVLQTFNVASAARVAVPEPGAAHPAGGIKNAAMQSHLAKAI